jgi:histidine triad (HIT) family protein
MGKVLSSINRYQGDFMTIQLPQRTPCPFCENVAGRNSCAFIFRSPIISSFVNPRQYGKGSVLIIPNRHASTILDLTGDEICAIYQHAQAITAALSNAYHPHGYNIFQNNGVAAGQSVPHFHLHIVPRYGDENPHTIFGEQFVDKTPLNERVAIAAAIKEHLQPSNRV